MAHLTFDDIDVTYDVQGDGDPVVFVHASPFVSWYGPLIELLPELSTLTYRRRLRKPDRRPYRALTVAEDASICARLLDHIGWPTAHVVGHSYGCLVALQLAIDAPERVASVALLEPALRRIPSSAQVLAALQPVIAAYQAGDVPAAVDGFLRHVCGDDYRAALDGAIPGAFAEAVGEADLFFQAELPAVQGFSFGSEEAQRVTQPVLNVVGAESVPRFVEGSEVIKTWFPYAERVPIPDTGHLLMVQNPRAVAHALQDHVSRHPIGRYSPSR